MSLAQFAIFRDDGFGHAAHRAQLALERGDAPPRHLEVELFGTISGVVRAEAQPQLLGPRPAAGQLALQLGGFVDLGIQPLEVIARALGRDMPRFARFARAALGGAQDYQPLLDELSFGNQLNPPLLGMGELFRLVVRAEQAYDAVLPTAELNRALQSAVEAQAPPSVRGRPVRLFYATQTGRRPPEVTVFASAPEGVSTSYARYVNGRLARAFGLVGVPLRLVFRARPRADAARARGRGARSRRSAPPRGRGAPRRR